ncbi:hypothetical protein quinque_002883 [Culex quinquefasciatus]
MDRAQKKNTVGFDFGRDGVMPTLKEAITFLVQVLKIKDTEVHSVYLDISDKTNGCEPVDYAAALKGLGSPLPTLPALPLPAIPNGERLMSLVNEPDDRMIVSPKEGGDSEGTVKPENRMIVSPKEGGDSEETVEAKKRRTDSPKEGGESDGRVEPDRQMIVSLKEGGESDGAGHSMELSPNGVEPPKPPRGRPTDKTPKGESGKPQPRLTVPNLLKVLDGRSRSRSAQKEKPNPKN